jgi:phosphoglycerate dehydrogenase-like enzyme
VRDFKVGLSSDLDDGKDSFTWGDISIDSLEPLPWNFLKPHGPDFTPESVKGFDAIAFAAPSVIAGSFGAPDESPIVIARFGVGYDNIDLAECTRAGVALTITPDGSKKPVATAALTLLLTTMHNLLSKNLLAKSNQWSRRLEGLGQGLNGKTIATIGLGNISTEFFRLIAPFDCTRIAYDPWKTQAEADLHDVKLVELEQLFAEADAVIVLAALTPSTKHLVGKKQFDLMKKNAILINISRGPIVDEKALIDALDNGKIAGAGLDVFESEPPSADNPLLTMGNVIAVPHNLAWTDELALGMGRSAFASIKSISHGVVPEFVVNKDVLDTPAFLRKIATWQK